MPMRIVSFLFPLRTGGKFFYIPLKIFFGTKEEIVYC